MRILHVVATGERRGAETFAADLVAALGTEDVQQTVAVLRAPNGASNIYGAPVRLLSRAPILRGAESLRVGVELSRLIRTWKPWIVQVHGGEPLKWAATAAPGTRPRMVYRRIGDSSPWIGGPGKRLLYSALVRRASRVVAVAETTRADTLRTFRLAADRVVTIPNAVDPARVRATRGRAATRAALGLPATASVMISIGALGWEKDPYAAVEVLRAALSAGCDTHLLLVGDGPLRAGLEKKIADDGLRDRVQVLGSREDVPNLLAASDLLILPSRTEGMPAVLIEAGMAGLPAVSYRLGGIPEVIREGQTGLLAPPGDRRCLATHAIRLLANEELRSALGNAAREWCGSQFDIHPIAGRYLALYHEVTGSR